MRARPTVSILLLLLSGLSLLPIAGARAQVGWETLTSFRTVRKFAVFSDTVYAVTSGGLLRIAAIDAAPKSFLNTDGLGTVDLFDLVRDSAGIDWIAAAGRIIRRDMSGFQQIPLLDAENKLFDAAAVADDGAHLWAGTALGLALIQKKKSSGELVEFYDRFGSLNPGAAVNGIAFTGDSIWLATNAGIAMARRNNLTALNAPGNWTSWNLLDFPALGSDTIRRIVSFRDSLYVASSRGVFAFDRTVTPPLLHQVAATANQPMADLVVSQDSLFLVTRTDEVVVLPGGRIILAPNRPLRTMSRTSAGSWYNGLDGSLVVVDRNNASVPYTHLGLRSNDIQDIAVARPNLALAASISAVPLVLLSNGGVDERNGADWTPRYDPQGWISNNLIAADADHFVAALEGGGIVDITAANATRYDTTATTLRGVSEGPNFIPVRDLAFQDGILYAACYRAFNSYPIAFVRQTGLGTRASWDSLGFSDGITDNFVVSVAAAGDYLAVGTETNGLFLLTTGGNPFRKQGIRTIHLTETSGNLISNTVRVARFSPEGELWIGTNFGLSRIDPAVETRATDVALPGQFGPDIADLEFDARGVLWMGAANGLASLDIPHATYTVYTTQTSGLVDDNVRAVTADLHTNDIYAATPHGVSRLLSGQGELSSNRDSLRASPNPFIFSDNGDERLRFNAAFAGELAIFTASGDLVFRSSVLEWDGRNQHHDPVASGVYLFTITGADGQTGRGKFLLVRQ